MMTTGFSIVLLSFYAYVPRKDMPCGMSMIDVKWKVDRVEALKFARRGEGRAWAGCGNPTTRTATFIVQLTSSKYGTSII